MVQTACNVTKQRPGKAQRSSCGPSDATVFRIMSGHSFPSTPFAFGALKTQGQLASSFVIPRREINLGRFMAKLLSVSVFFSFDDDDVAFEYGSVGPSAERINAFTLINQGAIIGIKSRAKIYGSGMIIFIQTKVCVCAGGTHIQYRSM